MLCKEHFEIWAKEGRFVGHIEDDEGIGVMLEKIKEKASCIHLHFLCLRDSYFVVVVVAIVLLVIEVVVIVHCSIVYCSCLPSFFLSGWL